jgi:hypothetical protein
MKINPDDQNIIKNLAFLEQTGEDGFSSYGSGDVKKGKELIRNSLSQSAQSISAIRDPDLRNATQALFRATSEAVQAYLRNPSEETLGNLQTDLGNYKSFLDSHQG